MSDVTMPPFDVHGPLPQGRVALEASAGTGKTWTIAALVVRHVAAGTPLDQLLVVTFTRAATAELRDRIRTRLAEAHRHVGRVRAGAPRDHDDLVLQHLVADDGGPVTDDVLATTERRLAAALSDFDAATITTIHGFCQRVLASAGYVGDVDGSAALVEDIDHLLDAATRDAIIRSYAEEHDVAAHGERPSDDVVRAVASLAMRDPDVPVRPDADDQSSPAKARRTAAVAADVARRLEAAKRARGVVTFDDLLVRLRDSLRDPDAGETIAEALRGRYRVALIDEFQDTDPVQWEIFQRVFADSSLVLIGDPKQAIYSFRGADVFAYLDAVGDPATSRATLGVNHRSDASLVAALNGLFDRTTFGDDRIPARPVDARHDDARVEGLPDTRLEFRVSPSAGGADPHRAAIAEDLADQIVALLQSGARIGPVDERRNVLPGDCAVLVRSNDQAAMVKDVLSRRGVHAVINGVGSVLETPAATDWGLLLAALDRPASPPKVRALALSRLVGTSPRDVGEADDTAAVAMHDRAHEWARVLRTHGVATLMRTIARDTDLIARLLGEVGGDRYLTDFEHVGELLHDAGSSERLGPSSLLGWLLDQANNSTELPPDQRARRLESDAHAVQVLTVHRSKGLQFPFVFLPFLMGTPRSARPPIQYYDRALGRMAVDLGTGDAAVTDAARGDEAGELLRLLYVAMTRAEHRVVAWWFRFNQGKKGYLDAAVGRVLFTDRDEAMASADHLPGTFGPTKTAQAFDAAIGRIGPTAAWALVPDVPARLVWDGQPPGLGDPVLRDFTGDVDRSWQRASYSALTRPVERTLVSSEPDRRPEKADEDDLDQPTAPPEGDLLDRELPLGAQPAGAAFGTMVHAVLEHVDLAADDLDAAMARQVDLQAARAGFELDDPAGLAAGLVLAARTPLGPDFGDVTLAGTPRHDRLDELEFELPLAQVGNPLTLDAIADVLADTLGADDPFVAYPQRLRDRTLARRVRGHLTGSIDLVLRRHADAGPVFHVVDHKSNRLFAHDVTGSAWHYRQDGLVAAMTHSHYPLQALLYLVGLHRFLRWKLGDYDAERHLGASGYLFVRGMVGPDAPSEDGQPCGVMAWRPSTAAILATSDLLEAGR